MGIIMHSAGLKKVRMTKEKVTIVLLCTHPQMGAPLIKKKKKNRNKQSGRQTTSNIKPPLKTELTDDDQLRHFRTLTNRDQA